MDSIEKGLSSGQGHKGGGAGGLAEIEDLCESFAAAVPKYLAAQFGSGVLEHIDVARHERQRALSAVQLMGNQSLSHYLRVVTDIDDEGLDLLLNAYKDCLLYTSPSPRDRTRSRMPSSA